MERTTLRIWKNRKTGKWMLIGEQRYMSEPIYPQKQLFDTLHNVCKNDPNCRGFHLIQFEKTNPEDGKTFLDGKEITKEELIKFLQFKD